MQNLNKGNITVVYPELKIASGTGSYVSNVLNGLNATGVHYRAIGIRKHEFSFNGKPYFGFVSQFLNSSFKYAKTTIVHSLSPGSIIRGTNIVTVHDIIPLINKEAYLRKWRDKMAFNLNTGKVLSIPLLLLSSNVLKNQLIKYLDIEENRLRVIPLSINSAVFYPSEKPIRLNEDKIKVVMVSDFNPRKRVDLVIKALRDDPEIEFYHIGPVNSWKSKFEEAQALAMNSNNIHLLGSLDVNLLRDHVSGADVFVYLSEAEGFGLPPLEAMACGTNVIVSDIEIFHETLSSNATFTKLDQFTADAVKGLFKNKINREGLVNFAARYSIDSYTERLLEIYDQMDSGRNKS